LQFVTTITQLKLNSLDRIREARLGFDSAYSEAERNEALRAYDLAIDEFRRLASIKESLHSRRLATRDASLVEA
jgi:hypothetical protein